MEIRRIEGKRFPRYLTLQDAMSLDDWHLLRAGESVPVDDEIGDTLITSGSCCLASDAATTEGQEE